MILDPALSQALATLVGTIATVLLWWGAYQWGPNRREAQKIKKNKKNTLKEGEESNDENAE